MMELRGLARFWGRISAEVVAGINLASFGPFVVVPHKPESTLTNMKMVCSSLLRFCIRFLVFGSWLG
ncbi:hypothetical protein PSY31_22830, partial [Shigella flexneri]|nr:hypothetical protein [Shigella flexneri]